MKPEPQVQPLRRLRRVAIAAFVSTQLLLLGLVLGPTASSVGMPGKLTSSHALLTENCEACHASSTVAVKGFLDGLLPSKLRGIAQ